MQPQSERRRPAGLNFLSLGAAEDIQYAFKHDHKHCIAFCRLSRAFKLLNM
jgi:phosphosulfolactate phosphohydrolase-like enzyme